MSYRIRPAERHDLAALAALAESQARARQAHDPRLPPGAQVVPFLSGAHSLGDALSWRHHATYAAEQDGVLVGGINVYRVEQHESDQFATYYPRRFGSIGLLAVHATAPGRATADLIARAQEQASRWKTPALLTQNASADRAMGDALRALGFRTYYHYALRKVAPAEETPTPTLPRYAGEGASAPARFRAGGGEGTGLIVRPAVVRDLDAVVRLGMGSVHYHASLEPTMQVARDEPRKMHERLEAAIRDGEQSCVLVAELDGDVVGFYSIYVQEIDDTWAPPLFANGRYGLIAEVAVDEPVRARGIGHRIFAEAGRWFDAHRVDGIWLIYLPHNPLSSRFWTGLGFEPVWEIMLRDA